MNEHLGLCYSILRAVERKADEEAKITYAVERSQLAREVAKPAEFYLQQPNATLPSVLSSSLSSAIKHYKVAQQVALNAPKTPIPQKVAVKVAGQTGLKDFFQAKQDPPPAAPENGQGEHSDAWLAPTRGLVELYVVESMYSEAEAEVAKAMEFETQFSPEELRRFEAPQQKMQLLKRVSAEESDLCIAGNALLGESAFPAAISCLERAAHATPGHVGMLLASACLAGWELGHRKPPGFSTAKIHMAAAVAEAGESGHHTQEHGENSIYMAEL